MGAQPADVQDRAKRAGRDWALALIAATLRDGRTLEGGFPGTLSEARLRALAALPPAEPAEPLGDEFVRAVYTAARAAWNTRGRSRSQPDAS